MAYPKDQQDIADRVGPSWCFAHSEAMPCATCAKIAAEHPFMGRCFDCKRELASDREAAEQCSCGSRVRTESVCRR